MSAVASLVPPQHVLSLYTAHRHLMQSQRQLRIRRQTHRYISIYKFTYNYEEYLWIYVFLCVYVCQGHPFPAFGDDEEAEEDSFFFLFFFCLLASTRFDLTNQGLLFLAFPCHGGTPFCRDNEITKLVWESKTIQQSRREYSYISISI